MADTSNVSVGIVRESTFGTTPASPRFEQLVVIGTPDLGVAPDTSATDEINAGRQIKDVTQLSRQGAGGYNMFLGFNRIDLLLESAMNSTWQNMPTIVNSAADTEIEGVTDSSDTYTVASGGASFVEGHLVQASGFTNSANNQIFRVASSSGTTVVGSSLTLTDEAAPPQDAALRVIGFEGEADDIDATSTGLASTSLDFTTLGLTVGQWVKIGGSATANKFSTSANNGWCRISVIAANALTFDIKPSSWSAETSSGSIQLQVWVGDYLRNGTTLISHSVEQKFADHSSPTYFVQTGQVVDSMNVTVSQNSRVTVDFTCVAKDGSYSTTRTSGASSKTATTNAVMNSTGNIGRIAENGSEISDTNLVTELSFSVENGRRSQSSVGSLTPNSYGSGNFNLTGNLTSYFDDASLVNKVINNTATSLDLVLKDDSGKAYYFDIPSVHLTAGSPGVAGPNEDVLTAMSYQAKAHSTLDYTFQIQRFWYTE